MSAPAQVTCRCGRTAEVRTAGWRRETASGIKRLAASWACPACDSSYLMTLTEVPAEIPAEALAAVAADLNTPTNAEVRGCNPDSDSNNNS